MWLLAGCVGKLRTFAFVYLSAVIVVCVSERVFWFWAPGIVAHLEGALFYSLPMAAVIWLMSMYRVSTGWGLLAVAPIFAYVTEGVITPILYTGGPFVPFFPAWFAAWHGLGSVVLGWYLLRKWMLAERWMPIIAASIGLGAFWGVWASTSRLPESVNDEDLIADLGELVVLGPGRFALYAGMVTLSLAVAHLLLGFVWPLELRVRSRSVRAIGAVVLIGATAWTVVVPWALPMFLVYSWFQIRVLRRHRDDNASTQGTLLFQLRGRIRVRAATPLALIAATAATVYLMIWNVDPSDSVLNVVFYSIIAIQTLVGGVLTAMAWRTRNSCAQENELRQTSEREIMAR